MKMGPQLIEDVPRIEGVGAGFNEAPADEPGKSVLAFARI
jgi:hypothetical protein